MRAHRVRPVPSQGSDREPAHLGRMQRTITLVSALALVVGACSGTSGAQVASLDDEQAAATTTTVVGVDPEEALLAFAQCMRDNGIADFEDPSVDADGNVDLRPGRLGGDDEVDPEDIRTAFEACADLMEGVDLGFERPDRSEMEDQVYELAECLRDQGLDVDDPTFSEPGSGQGGGPFGEDFDFSDPDVQAALEACGDLVPGQIGGGPPGGGPGGPPQDGGTPPPAGGA